MSGAGPPPTPCDPRRRPLGAPTGALPTPTAKLIGREAYLEALSALVRSGTHRLVTITGSGWVGRTRLAMVVLHREAPRLPGAAQSVDLAAVREPALVVPKVIADLGLTEPAGADPLDSPVGTYRGCRCYSRSTATNSSPGTRRC